MTLFEFIEDLKREIEENKSWTKMELEFCTIDGGGAKYSSIYESKGTIYIEVSIKKKQKVTLSEFVKIITKKVKENKGWGNKEIKFSTIYKDGSKCLSREYLSVYDSDDNVICIDIGTEEEDAEHIKAMLG